MKVDDFIENFKVDLYVAEYNFGFDSNKPERMKKNNGIE